VGGGTESHDILKTKKPTAFTAVFSIYLAPFTLYIPFCKRVLTQPGLGLLEVPICNIDPPS